MNIVVNQKSYHVEVYGKGEPVVLLHGFTGSTQTWDQILPLLQNNCQCILVDIIGHGKTDAPTYSYLYEMESVGNDIISILDKLLISKTALVGYSMGGRLALSIAVNHPDRISKLVLESSSPGLRSEEERSARKKSDEELAFKIEKYGLDWFIDYWESIPLFQSQKSLALETQTLIRKQRGHNNVIGLANSLRGMGTGSQPSYWDNLLTLFVPVLLICGEIDEKFCFLAVEMEKRLPKSRVEKIKAVGHAIHVEEPKFFGKIVSGFLFDQTYH